MQITAKTTKAELMAAYTALKVQQQSVYITWPIVKNTARLVWQETVWLVEDVNKLVRWLRASVDRLR